ncbi:Neogenin -like protein [Halotydeus destructor]|nr:Neogenin -like protein [Halotydeus destructor]
MSKFMSTSLFSCLLLFLHCSLAVAKSSQAKYASAKVDGNNTLQTQWLSDEALDENEPPPIPATLSLNPSATTIRLTWTPPKTTKVLIRGYTIGWGVGFPDVDTKSVDARQRSFVLENLKPSHQYVVSLRAYNNAGDGEPTYESSMTKIEDDPDPVDILPPIGLKIEVLSSTTVILSWTDTLPRGYSSASDGRFYTVQYSSNPHAANPKYKFINSTNLNTMIDDLKPFTQYEFAVKVTKGRQDSTWSMSVINTTQEAAPSSPPRDMTIVPSDGDPSEINIHWQPPKQPNGRITGYLIFYTTDNTKSDRDWAFEGVTGDKLTAELKGLLPDTTYYFKIQARNLKGYGPLSAEVSFRTMLLTYSARVTDGKSISTHTLYIIIAGISVVTILLLLVVSILLCKSKRAGGAYGRKPKGYIAAATSPRGKGSLKSKGSTRELNPPDLWIHHEQMELKALEKNHKDNMDGSLNSTPLNRNFAEPISAIEPLTDTLRKGGNQYMHDVLYDDVAKGPNSPTETTISFVSGTARRTVRAKPIMIPVDANAHNISSGINFEASTGSVQTSVSANTIERFPGPQYGRPWESSFI